MHAPRSRTSSRHSLVTRMFHAAFAVAIIGQLLLSLVMEGPHRDRPGDAFFTVHEYLGLVALVLAFGFWITILARHRGTPFSTMFPWFSGRSLRALWADIVAHVRELLALRIPAFDDGAPLPSAVHGLGLLLMTTMAITGGVYYAAMLAGTTGTSAVRFDMLLHHLFANLTWVYLIAHAGIAVLHHFFGGPRLGTMWAIREADRTADMG